MRRLRDRVAVVTGAASGIGRATAVALAREGAHLALVDVRAEGLHGTREEVLRHGREVTLHECDVASAEKVHRLADEVASKHGDVHILVNNAGVGLNASFEEQSLADFEWLMGVNFWGVVNGCRAFLPFLRQADEGHVVNVSSVFGIMGMPRNSAYCASKFAVYGLSESLRAELSDTRIGVTCVQPGGVATNIAATARVVGDAETEAMHARVVRSFTRMLPPERAAHAIVRGIKHNSHRVLITREARLIDAAKRAFPSWSVDLVAKRWRSFLPKVLDRVERG
jgi:short-subunit dehydrogenase